MQNKKYGKILYSHKQIVQVCKKLATQINKDFQKAEFITLICVLKGAMPFMAELMKYITQDVRVDFIVATTYKDNKSTGELKLVMDISHSIVGHDVIIVEDICESGTTLMHLTQHLKDKNPKSVSSVVLLDKPSGRKVVFVPNYIGVKHTGPFVAGFGFDDNGYLRNLTDIVEVK